MNAGGKAVLMKKKHLHNALICMGLFMRKPGCCPGQGL